MSETEEFAPDSKVQHEADHAWQEPGTVVSTYTEGGVLWVVVDWPADAEHPDGGRNDLPATELHPAE